MASLIHHFKIVTEGYRVPEGEVYAAVESPRGELGCYVVSDGGARPWRVKFRAPSFAALEATATTVQGAYIADLIAIVRLARHGDGRGRPLMARKFADEVRAIAEQYPSRAGGHAALRIAQERMAAGCRRRPTGGRRRAGLDTRVLQRRRDLYDMFHLARRRAPGRGVHEHLLRLRGAQADVLAAFESELGVCGR
jgi:hypothetical protein